LDSPPDVVWEPELESLAYDADVHH
jgi:hypothetical protein